MNIAEKIKSSKTQYINYLAVDIAEKLIICPTQHDIDKVEKSIKGAIANILTS